MRALSVLILSFLLILSCEKDTSRIIDASGSAKATLLSEISPPTNLSVQYLGGHEVKLKWSAPSTADNFSGRYKVQIKRASDADYGNKWSYETGDRFFDFNGVPGVSYDWRVQSIADGGQENSAWVTSAFLISSEEGGTIVAPTDVYVTISPDWENPSVVLSWYHDASIEGHTYSFNVRYKRGSGSWTTAKVSASQSYQISGVQLGSSYTAEVQAIADSGFDNSAWAGTSFTIEDDGDDFYEIEGADPTQLMFPQQISIFKLTSSVVKLSWVHSRGQGFSSFEVAYKTDSQSWDSPQASATTGGLSYTASDIEAHVAYSFRVRAVASTGYVSSDWSYFAFSTTYQDNPAEAASEYDLSNLPNGIPVESTGRGNQVTIDAVNTGLRRASCGDRDYWEGICNSSDYQAYVDGGFIDSDMCSLINLCDQGFDTFMRISPTSLWEQEYIATPNDPKSDWVRWPSNTDDPRYFVWEYVGISRSSKVFNPDALGLEPIPGHDNLFRLKDEVRIETVRGGRGEAGYVIFNDTSRKRSEVQTLQYGDRVVPRSSKDSNEPDVIESPGDGTHTEVVAEVTALKRAYDAACSGGSRSADCNSFCQSRRGDPGYCSNRESLGCDYDSNQDVVSWSDTCASVPEDHVSNTDTGVSEQCTSGVSYSCPHGDGWTVVSLDGEMTCTRNSQPGRTSFRPYNESECAEKGGTYTPRWTCYDNGNVGIVTSIEACSGTTEPRDDNCLLTIAAECGTGTLHSSGVCTVRAQAENSCN